MRGCISCAARCLPDKRTLTDSGNGRLFSPGRRRLLGGRFSAEDHRWIVNARGIADEIGLQAHLGIEPGGGGVGFDLGDQSLGFVGLEQAINEVPHLFAQVLAIGHLLLITCHLSVVVCAPVTSWSLRPCHQ